MFGPDTPKNSKRRARKSKEDQKKSKGTDFQLPGMPPLAALPGAGVIRKTENRKTELNQKTARSSVVVVKRTHMTDTGEGRPPGRRRRRDKQLDAANVVSHPRQRIRQPPPFCPPRVRRGECYGSQRAVLADKENRIARTKPAHDSPRRPLQQRHPPGPSFSLEGHGSPSSSSSTLDTDDDDDEDDDDRIPAGQADTVTENTFIDENPFIDAGFPPHLRGPGDGWEAVRSRRTSGGALGQEAPVPPALDHNQFKGLAGSLDEAAEPDDVASVKEVQPPRTKTGKRSANVPPEAAAAPSGPAKKRKSTTPAPALKCCDETNANATGVRQFNLVFEQMEKPDAETFKGFRPFKDYAGAFGEFDKWHGPDGKLLHAPVSPALRAVLCDRCN